MKVVREPRETVNTLSDISVSSSSSSKGKREEDDRGRERATLATLTMLLSRWYLQWLIPDDTDHDEVECFQRSRCNPWDEHFLNHGKCPGTRRPTLSYPFLSPVSHLSRCVHCLLRDATRVALSRWLVVDSLSDDSSSCSTIIHHQDARRRYDRSVTSVRTFVIWLLLSPLLFISLSFQPSTTRSRHRTFEIIGKKLHV